MEDTWRIEFVHSTHILHPNFVRISIGFQQLLYVDIVALDW